MNCKPNSLAMVVRTFKTHPRHNIDLANLLGMPVNVTSLSSCGCCWLFKEAPIMCDGAVNLGPFLGLIPARFRLEALPDEILMPIEPDGDTLDDPVVRELDCDVVTLP